MATLEQTREAARRRKANERARAKGLPEPYSVSPIQEEKEKSLRQAEHDKNLTWALEQDSKECFYKSECRSAVELLAIYEGNNDVSDEDPDVVDSKTGKRKQVINPSIQAIRIRAIYDDAIGKINPDQTEYKRIFEVNGVVSFQQWLDLRDKGRKRLFWLSGVMGKRLFHDTHQMVCDMFVQKNFDGLYFPEFERSDLNDMLRAQKRFANDGVTPTRTLLLFAPRGGWKSTIDGIDAVQWMLNAPDVRIMIITAFRPLAKTFLREIKGYFYLPPRGTPTTFQLLYPEYVLTGIDGRSSEPIRCPAATMDSKEPHLWITSMESSATGMRCDIRKADDIVDPKNSNDEELRQNLQHNFNGTNDLVEPWGFTDIIGTRYFTDDYYGTRMLPDEDGVLAPFAFLSISAWYPKPGFEDAYAALLDQPTGMSKVTADMVDVWFPYKLNFETLRGILLAKKERNTSNVQKERSFRNQQLNIATDPQEVDDYAVHFSKDVLRSHTYSSTAAPETGELIVTVDWAYSENRTSDFSVLVAIRRHTRSDSTQELVVLDIDYDKWKSSDLALHIVLFLKQHNPSRTLIERALGIDLLMMALRMYAQKYGCLHVLDSIKLVDIDNKPNAKRNRIKTLEILLANDRLHFVAGPWIDELYKQFERFTGEIKKGRKDDIPDSISLASRTLPQEMFVGVRQEENLEESEASQEKQEQEWRRQEHYKKVFGTTGGGGTRLHPAPSDHSGEMKLSEWYLTRNNPGYVPPPPPPSDPEPLKSMDPRDRVFSYRPVVKPRERNRIFGKNGPWKPVKENGTSDI